MMIHILTPKNLYDKFYYSRYKFFKIMNSSLYETNMAKFFSQNFHDKEFKRACQALLYKGYDVSRIPDSAIGKMDPIDAFKLKGKKGDAYFKFWFAKNGKFAFCTWANTMIDDHFNWEKKTRGNIIGNVPYKYNYEKSNDEINNMSWCYLIKYEDMPLVKDLQAARKESRKNATALLGNREYRKMNLERYEKMLKENNFSDGSEANFVKNVIQPLDTNVYKRYGFIALIMGWQNFRRPLAEYINSLEEFIQTLIEYDFQLSRIEAAGYAYNWTLEQIKSTAGNLVKYAKDVNKNNSAARIQSFVKAVTENSKKYQEFTAYASAPETNRWANDCKINLPVFQILLTDIVKYGDQFWKNLASGKAALTFAKLDVIMTTLSEMYNLADSNRFIIMLAGHFEAFEKDGSCREFKVTNQELQHLQKMKIYTKMLNSL